MYLNLSSDSKNYVGTISHQKSWKSVNYVLVQAHWSIRVKLIRPWKHLPRIWVLSQSSTQQIKVRGVSTADAAADEAAYSIIPLLLKS